MSTQTTTVSAGASELTLSMAEGPFRASLTTSSLEAGLDLVRLRIESASPAPPPLITLSWTIPVVDIEGCWHPQAGRNKGLAVDWGRALASNATSSAPVVCLYSSSGHNRLTFALSDALDRVLLTAGVHEENATIRCSITLFDSSAPQARESFQKPPQLPTPITSYEAVLRLDRRDVRYYEALQEVQEWWAEQPEYAPSPVPAAARLPMYSTWYSFHQQLLPQGIEEQCRLARALGCEGIIVDDGWQTVNNERGYAYCGDWEVANEKIPDMQAHVERVHALGLKYLLWYSVPFVGVHSKAWSRFSSKLLATNERLGAGVLDPRFPDVREFLITTYETAMREWNLDGFKLDFVDSFNPSPEAQAARGEGRDYDSVPQAVDRLLTDIMTRLRAMNPDVMVEFRQSYVGPLMRKYGNMFRAGDCPNDAVENRVRTLDIRLLGGNTAAHSDMLMWHPDEPVESAALQLLNVLFSVPQISVLLEKIPPTHVEMLRFWLSFWRDHRDVLLDGRLAPLSPTLLFPAVRASTDTKQVVAVYGEFVAALTAPTPATVLLVNGTLRDRIGLDVEDAIGIRDVEVRDCCGGLVREERLDLGGGLHSIAVPPAGLAMLKASQ